MTKRTFLASLASLVGISLIPEVVTAIPESQLYPERVVIGFDPGFTAFSEEAHDPKFWISYLDEFGGCATHHVSEDEIKCLMRSFGCEDFSQWRVMLLPKSEFNKVSALQTVIPRTA